MFVSLSKRLKLFVLLALLLVLVVLSIVYMMDSLIVSTKRSIHSWSRLTRNGGRFEDVNKHLRLLRKDYEKTLVQYELEKLKLSTLKTKAPSFDFESHSEELGKDIICNHDLFLLIQVHSNPKNYMSRQAIRLSWGRMERFIGDRQQIIGVRSWKTVFLVGKSSDPDINNWIAHEAAIHKDIVAGEFEDTFRNLHQKMILSLNWPLERKCNASYMLKTDEDCYVNVGNLVHWLNSYHTMNGTRPIYAGRVQKHLLVIRDNNSRYYVAENDHPQPYFHPYVSGGGYVLSGNLLPLLSKVSKASPLFPNEDALMGFLMHRLSVKPTDNLKFLPLLRCKSEAERVKELSMCALSRQILMHRVSGAQQLKMHFNSALLNSLPSLCSLEESYENLRDQCYILNNKGTRNELLNKGSHL